MKGKGQEKKIAEKGVTFSGVLPAAGFNKGDYSSVRAVSFDEFTAGISTEEIDHGKAAFQIKDPACDGRETFRLIFFDGSNSKRQVKDVERIGLGK